ncbi:MAG: hypothetical protein OXG84_18470, partial [Chloroflexi bacterium]|nr:hypothetical protein [Chloroflexota bacterium]
SKDSKQTATISTDFDTLPRNAGPSGVGAFWRGAAGLDFALNKTCDNMLTIVAYFRFVVSDHNCAASPTRK